MDSGNGLTYIDRFFVYLSVRHIIDLPPFELRGENTIYHSYSNRDVQTCSATYLDTSETNIPEATEHSFHPLPGDFVAPILPSESLDITSRTSLAQTPIL